MAASRIARIARSFSLAFSGLVAGSRQIRHALVVGACATIMMGAVAQSAIAAPTVSISSPAANANFGAPARIAITATATPSSGTSITKVEFFRGGSTLIGTATTSPYTVTWNSVAVGNYSLTAKATDSAGGTKTSSAVAITVKANVVPTVSISSPAASANFGAPATITITATATDTDGTIAKIDFFNGATLLGTATTSPYKFTWTNVAIGNYSLTAKATDNSGGVKTSTAVAITVKTNVVPTVSISSPAANATFTTPASIPITATASDTDGTIAKVEFFNGATLLGTTTTSPYAFTWTGVAAGSYALIANATDNSGGVKTSVAVAISVRTPPTVNITVPANNASFIAPASIPITASATPAGSATISKVDFLKGATLLGTKTVAPYTFTWTGVAVGSYSLTAKATDSNGLATTSAPIAVTVGANPPPTVSITAPASNASFAAPASVAITASATAASGLTISKVDFYSGATLLGTKTTSPYIFNWTGVAAGSYSLTAKATDSAGAITTAAAVPITVTPPIARPTVSITSPISGATFNGPATILITATAAATAGGASISKVDFYNDSTFLGTSSSAPYSYNWTNVPAGEFLLSAKATDSLTVTGTSWPIYAIVDGADSCTTTPPLAANDSESKMAALGNLPMTFEINEGQANPDVRFQARGSNYQLFLTSTERVFALQGAQSAPQGNPAVHSPALDAKGVAVRMRFVGANPNAVVTGVDPVATKSNYLIGSDRTAWHANIPHFAKVRYEGLYPGIDEVYYGTQGKLEYDLVVAPRANPHTVRFAVDGIDGMSVDLNGDLLLDTKLGTLVQKSPVAYQDIDGQRRAVKAQYQILAANEVAFLLGDYDTSHPLVIDPVLGYSTFVGGANSDSRATGIAISRCGETFITGWTRATDYPVTAGAFDPSAVPNSQMGFVSKLNQAGTALLYSTFVTGSVTGTAQPQSSTVAAIAVDSTGHAYIAGETYATDFPTTPGSLSPASPNPGGTARFVAKLNTNGSAFLYSTYLPGAAVLASIAVDSAGSAYVTGQTGVWKLNPSGSALVYSTTVGGTATRLICGGCGYEPADKAQAIAVDAAGNAYVAGTTVSLDLPVTAGAFQPTNPTITGGTAFPAGFITKINPAGSGLVYSSYLGNTENLHLFGLALDTAGNAYVTGTSSRDFLPGYTKPVKVFNQNNVLVLNTFYAFVAKMQADGSTLGYFSLIGGGYCNPSCSSNYSEGIAIALDPTGNAWVAGNTQSNQIPLVNPLLSQFSDIGVGDRFAAKLSPAGDSLLFSTLLGSDFTTATARNIAGIAVDSIGSAYISGSTNKADFPTTAGAFQRVLGVGTSAFVAKIDASKDTTTSLTASPNPGAAGSVLTLTANITGHAPTGTVTFLDGATTLGTASVSGTSAVLTTTLLTGGDHMLFANYGGDTQNAPSSTSLSIHIASPATTVFLTGITDGTTFVANSGAQYAGANVVVTANATDGNTLKSVTINIGETFYIWTPNSPIFSNSFALPALSAGFYTIFAAAVDNNGKQASTSPVRFVVNATTASPPAVAITAPANGASLMTPPPITITANATPAGSTTISNVVFYQGATIIGMVSASPFSSTWNDAPAGTYSIIALATDSTGGRRLSAPITITNTVTTPPPPTVRITSPADNGRVGSGNPLEIVVTAQVSPNFIAKVEIFDGAALLTTLTPPATSSFTFTYTGQPPALGSHTLTAKVTDSLGGTATSAPVTVNVVTSPTITLSTLSNFYLAGSTVDLITGITAQDTASLTKVEFFTTSGGINTLIGTVTTVPYNLRWPSTAAGSYTFIAKVSDNQGFTATSAPVSITVGSNVAIQFAAGLSGSTVDDDTVFVSGTTTAPPNSSVMVNGQFATVTSSGQFFLNDLHLQPGVNTVTATVTAPDGQTANQSITITRSTSIAPFVVTVAAGGIATATVPYNAAVKIENPGNTAYATITLQCDDPAAGTTLTAIGIYQCGYVVAGVYGVRVTVKDSLGGVIYSVGKVVKVEAPIQRFGLLTSIYNGVNERLKAGNIDGAVSNFIYPIRENYRAAFTAAGSGLGAMVDGFGVIKSLRLNGDFAELIVVRNTVDGEVVFSVLMVLDTDGIWRINGF